MSPGHFLFCEERIYPLFAVLCHARRSVHIRGKIKTIVEIHPVQPGQRLFDQGHGRPAVLLRQFLGKLCRACLQSGVRHNAGDESEGTCLIGSDGIPPQGKLTGSSFPDPLDQEDENNGGNKTDVDFGIAERGMLLRCQDKIAHFTRAGNL